MLFKTGLKQRKSKEMLCIKTRYLQEVESVVQNKIKDITRTIETHWNSNLASNTDTERYALFKKEEKVKGSEVRILIN